MSKKKEKTVCIGIDLGTTNTAAGMYRNHHAEIIYNREAKNVTPSAVYYPPTDSTVIVGSEAIERGLECRTNFMLDIKRLIGRDFHDIYVQSFINKQRQIKKGFIAQRDPELGVPRIKLKRSKIEENAAHTAWVTPVDVSTEILISIKEDARVFLHADNIEAVISVPAYFSYAQRAATKTAAENAGLTVLGLITEPVAAAIYYTYNKFDKEELILVVDLGGGTLDVSLIACSKTKFEVKSIEGDMFLGGRDFDDVIFGYIKEELEKEFGPIDVRSTKGDRLLRRIHFQATGFKEKLSFNESYEYMFEYDGIKECRVKLTRLKFEQMVDHFFHRVIHKVENCLANAHVSKKEVDRVVLAGGSTRIPKLKKMLSEYFEDKELHADINPDVAVALGASIHAALLKGDTNLLEVYRIDDVAPHSLGILAKYDLMVAFIRKGTQLPTYVTQTMETSQNDQTAAIFNIYEGERTHALKNKKLGQFVIENLPSGKAGHVEFEVTFFLDESGLLRVTATENTTKKSNQLEIRMKELTTCDSLLSTSLQMSSIIDEEDRKFEEFCRLRLVVDTYTNGLMYDIECPTFKPTKHEIIKALDKFNKFYMACKDLDALQKEFAKLQQKINCLVSAQ